MNGNWRHNADGLADEKQREPHIAECSRSGALRGAQSRSVQRLKGARLSRVSPGHGYRTPTAFSHPRAMDRNRRHRLCGRRCRGRRFRFPTQWRMSVLSRARHIDRWHWRPQVTEKVADPWAWAGNPWCRADRRAPLHRWARQEMPRQSCQGWANRPSAQRERRQGCGRREPEAART